jgi:hypothetical protein
MTNRRFLGRSQRWATDTVAGEMSQVGQQRDPMPELNLRQSAFICGWSFVCSCPFARPTKHCGLGASLVCICEVGSIRG